jgi:uncharacterized lipoprotein YddW (UPF0748 family)
MIRRRAPWILLVALACGAESPPAEPPAPVAPASTEVPRLGLWVLAEGSQRVLEDPGRIAELVARAEALGVSDLFVQVYRGGRSWFASSHADDAPYRAIVAAHGIDPLAVLLDRAHEAGLRVHAWFNCLRVARNREAPLLVKLGRDAVLVDRKGRSLLDYPDQEVPQPDRAHVRMGTPGLWLDPATPGVIEYLEATLDDLIAAAPELDGLHLDIIRHPLALPFAPGSRWDFGLDFGYGAPARARFIHERGAFRRGNDWDTFRRARVDEVVERLAARLPDHWQHSAAVIPYAERAYFAAMQDWRGWIERDWIDFAVAMAYTTDDAVLRYVGHGLRGGIGGDRVWLGLGSWLFVDQPERLTRQLEIAAAAKPAGLVLFSYDALADAPGSFDAITGARP